MEPILDRNILAEGREECGRIARKLRRVSEAFLDSFRVLRTEAMAQQAEMDAVDISKNDGEKDKKESHVYSGPAVISYDLEGRTANYLPVPAYKGFGSGDVLVQIVVNQKGRVTSAHVVIVSSTSDQSLHEFALEAARRSKFSSSTTAPKSQTGSILYRFVAQ